MPRTRHAPVPNSDQVLAFLCERIAFYTSDSATSISAGDDPLDFGLSSMDTARVCSEIETKFGAPLDPATFFDSTSVGEIVQHVLTLSSGADSDRG
ncbi:hypothetical protein MASR1M32_28990 [Rhodobacter sp.]